MMGAENSTVEDFQLTDTLPDKPWRIENGVLSSTNTPVSVFSSVKNDKKYWVLLRSLTKQLRLFRHPAIIQYIESDERPEGPFLMTEQVKPLISVLDSQSATEVCAGLHSLLEAVEFLHDKAGVSHNNIHLGAVYVAVDGSWRLGGLEFACRFTMATDTHLASNRASRNQEALAPEEKAGKLLVEPSLGHVRDVYSLAVLIEPLLEHLGDLGDLTKTFELRIQDECLSMDPRQRPQVKSLLADRLFTMEFLDIESFLKTIVLKSEEERNAFYKTLVPKLLNLPEELVARRLVPCLFTRYVVMDPIAVRYVLPSLLTPCTDMRPTEMAEGEVAAILTAPIFECYVVPRLVKMFSVRDYHLHVLLLQHLPAFLHMISKEDLELEILPELLVGLRDSSELIAAHSLHALADLIPILGRDIVIGGNSKPNYPERVPKETSENSTRGHVKKDKHREQKLVDLITQRSTVSQKKEELEERQKERDRKRKEAEIRREERKRKLEEKRLAQQKAKDLMKHHPDVSVDTVEPEPEEICPEIETLEEPPQIIDRTIEPAETCGITEVVDDSDRSVGDEIVDNNNDDWGDFDEKNDTDFSDEIEEELKTMESSCNNSKQIESDRSVSKPLKLKTNSDDSKIATKQSQNSIGFDAYSNISKGQAEPFPRTLQTKRANTQSTVKQSNELGSEFDVKSIAIKVKEQSMDPFDLLNDLAPKFDKKTPVIDANPRDSISEKIGNVGDAEGGSTGISFELNNSAEVAADGDGWSDDGW